jgi:hypothetical protein
VCGSNAILYSPVYFLAAHEDYIYDGLGGVGLIQRYFFVDISFWTVVEGAHAPSAPLDMLRKPLFQCLSGVM